MSASIADAHNIPIPPPTKHQLALMTWLAVFPTLTALTLLLATVFDGVPIVLRTFILVTIAVPIVVDGVMPHLHRARRALVVRRQG